MATSVDSREVAVARVYALALLDLAAEEGRAEETVAEVAALAAEVAASDELARFLASPVVGEARRREILDRLLRDRFSDLVVDTLQVMNGKGRLGLLRALAVACREELDRRQGRLDVEVASAVALSEPLRERLREALRRATGREPRLAERVAPELLGGLLLRMGDRKIDASVAAELARLDERLRDRAPSAARVVME